MFNKKIPSLARELELLVRTAKVGKPDIQKINDTIIEFVHECEKAMVSGSAPQALNQIEKVIKMIPFIPTEEGMVSMTDIEYDIYLQVTPAAERKERTTMLYDSLYYLYGTGLLEIGNIAKAETALLTSMKWNPVSAMAYAELGTTYQMQGKWEKVIENIKEGLGVTFQSHVFGRMYRSLAYCYVEKEEYQTAIDIYALSMLYDTNQKIIDEEVSYITKQTGKKLDARIPEEAVPFLRGLGIQAGPSSAVKEVIENGLKADTSSQSKIKFLTTIKESLTSGAIAKAIYNGEL